MTNTKLICSDCKREYTDKESIDVAMQMKEDYTRLYPDRKGICPCPDLSCLGELILQKIE